jgi:uncharacterized protein (TIGR03437 family)
MIAGVAAEVLYAGSAPGLVTGLVQVNVRIPQEIRPDPAAPVSLFAGSAATPDGVTIAVDR